MAGAKGLPQILRLAAAAWILVFAAGHQQNKGEDSTAVNPIRKVVTLLENMAKKLSQEAKKEEELYDKFACYCKTGTADLTTAITESTTKVPALQSAIEEAQSAIAQLKLDLREHTADRNAANEAITEATGIREKERAAYEKEAKELKGYVAALSRAIPAIENGMSGTGLVQLGRPLSMILRKAATADAAATDDDRQSVLNFLSGGSMGGYTPKGGEVVGILRGMKENFEHDLADVEQKEADANKIYTELMAAKTQEVQSLTASIEKKTARSGELEMEIVHMKDDLSSTEAALIEDKEFLKNLDKDCGAKKGEYEERVRLRNEELLAVHETIKILNDDDALDLFKKTLASASFMQVHKNVDAIKQKVLSILRDNAKAHGFGGKLDVRFLELVLSGKKVDFSKVIKMIDEMIVILAEEQADDDAKQAYCTKQIDTAREKGKKLSKNAGDLEASIEELKGTLEQLGSELKTLKAGIAELDRSVEDAAIQRKKERDEFLEVLQSNQAAKELLGVAITRLNKFYTSKESLVQIRVHALYERASTRLFAHGHDEPPPAPMTWDGDYQKKQGEASSVVSLIKNIIRDLEKETAEAEHEEESSQKAHAELMDDAAKKRAQDVKSISVKESSKADSEELLTAKEGDLSSTKKEFLATERYEAQLHSDCDWLLQNFDLRKTARAEEKEALKGAKAVLLNTDISLLQSKRGHQNAALRGKGAV